MFTGNSGHLKSFDYVGLHRYSLTFCAHARTPTFTSGDRVDLARYIVANPVRAGLVERVEDYPFVGSCVYELAEILDAVQSAVQSA